MSRVANWARGVFANGIGLFIGSITDGQFLKRSGSTVTSAAVVAADLNLTSNQRVIGRNAAGLGAQPASELSASTVLDWVGSTRGQILYRGALSWSALSIGSAGKMVYSATDPAWGSIYWDESNKRLGINASSPQQGLDTGTGKITGGTNSGSYRTVIDPSGDPTFATVDITYPSAGKLRFAEVSVIGTNDIFFQAVGGATSYLMLECFAGAGVFICSANNDAPVLLGTNRTERLRVTDQQVVYSVGLKLRRQTTAVSVTITHGHCILGVTSTAAPRTITLPSASTAGAGSYIIIKDESGGAAANNITVQRAGADNVDGGTTATINTNYGSVTLYSDGTSKWFTV